MVVVVGIGFWEGGSAYKTLRWFLAGGHLTMASSTCKNITDIYNYAKSRWYTFSGKTAASRNDYLLAESGLMCDGIDVFCVYCLALVNYDNFFFDDEPVAEHLRVSPTCPLLRGNLTNNIPLNKKYFSGIVQPQVIVSDYVELQERAGGVLYKPAAAARLENKKVLYTIPKSIVYASRSNRLASFARWKYENCQSGEKLAECGFVNYGSQLTDRVFCFYCDVDVFGWTSDCDPWEIHAKLSPSCGFLLLNKTHAFVVAAQTMKKRINPLLFSSAISVKNQLKYRPVSASLSSRVSSTNNNNNITCKICIDRPIQTLMLPCRHAAACIDCAILLGKCPICRCAIDGIDKIYFC